MGRILLVLRWPTGIAIFGGTVLLARHSRPESVKPGSAIAAAARSADQAEAVTWGKNCRWPPVALVTAMLIRGYVTIAIKYIIHRMPPPSSGETSPSGGTCRAVLVYGLNFYLLWNEFSGRRRTAAWCGAVAAALRFNKDDSRNYPRLRWFTDAQGGLVHGCLLLFVLGTGARSITGRAAAPGQAAALVHPALADEAHAEIRR